MSSAQTAGITCDDEKPKGGACPGKENLLWFGGLLLFSVAIRLFDPTGWLGSDDTSYFRAAEHLRTGQTIQRVHHHYARAAVVIPVAVSTSLFGDNPAAVALPSGIASVVCVALVAILGRLIWGWWEGLFAATAVSVLPFFRVLSTTGYPDVHACLWMVAAFLLAIQAVRQGAPGRAIVYGSLSGLASGLMASAKILAAPAVIGLFTLAWMQHDLARKRRLLIVAAIISGGLVFCLLEGLFYLWIAEDFFFQIHATRNTQSLTWAFPENAYYEAETFVELAYDRFAMLFDPARSGWGHLAVIFWPAALALLCRGSKDCAIAVWAVAIYVAVALVPVSFRNGPQPFPIFDGRNVLFACIPFALCSAWLLRRAAAMLLTPVCLERSLIVLLPGIVVLSYASASGLEGFRDRPTARIGRAIEVMARQTDWDETQQIFMPASLYVRHGFLFPRELRPQLRVAADENSPDWWRHATVDILSRSEPLAAAGSAYLIATPRQLRGEPESWDYDVTLPKAALENWRSIPPQLAMCRSPDKTIGPCGEGIEPLLVLLGPTMTCSASASPPPAAARDAAAGHAALARSANDG